MPWWHQRLAKMASSRSCCPLAFPTKAKTLGRRKSSGQRQAPLIGSKTSWSATQGTSRSVPLGLRASGLGATTGPQLQQTVGIFWQRWQAHSKIFEWRMLFLPKTALFTATERVEQPSRGSELITTALRGLAKSGPAAKDRKIVEWAVGSGLGRPRRHSQAPLRRRLAGARL